MSMPELDQPADIEAVGPSAADAGQEQERNPVKITANPPSAENEIRSNITL